MGVFTANNQINLENQNVIECQYEPCMEGACAIIAESEVNYNLLMQTIGINELSYFEKNGHEMVYEAADVKGFLGKAKNFFMNILEKIRGLFKKFFAMFNGYIKSDEAFLKKYKRDLMMAETAGFKYKGFKYNLDAVTIAKANGNIDIPVSATIKLNEPAIDTELDKAKDKVDSVEKMRGQVFGGGKLTATEFNKELYSKLRSGEDSKKEIEGVNISDQISIISGTKDGKKKAEEAYKQLETAIKEDIKFIEAIEKELLNATTNADGRELRSKQIRHANNRVYFLKEKLAILQVVNGSILTAIKDNNRQAKAICARVITHKAVKENASVNESGTFFDTVKFI